MKVQLIEILDKLINLGGNHDRVALMELRHQFFDFLREEEQLLISHDDESITTAVNAIHFIDAQTVYAATTDRIKSGKHLHSFFDHLITAEKWNYYELRFLIGSLSLVDTVKQTALLANKACEMLRDFKAITPTDFLSSRIAANTIQRMLYAKFFDESPDIDLEGELTQWFLKSKYLVLENTQLQYLFDLAEIRQAVFKQDQKLVYQLMQKFNTNYDEKVVEIMSGEVDFYMASKSYNQLYLEQFKKIS